MSSLRGVVIFVDYGEGEELRNGTSLPESGEETEPAKTMKEASNIEQSKKAENTDSSGWIKTANIG